jgi:site-specific recombinase XerD
MSYSFNFEIQHVRKTDKEYPIQLRITIDRKHKRVTLPITVSNKKHFNGRARRGNWIRSTDPDHEIKNEKLLDKLREFQDAADEVLKKKIDVTFHNLIYTAGNANSEDFFAFTEKQKERLREQERFNYLKHYTSVVKKIKEFVLLRFHLDELKFSDLTVGFIKDYEAYLGSIGNQTNTVGKNLKIIRAIYNDAVDEDLATPEANPFLKIKIKREQTHNKSLSEEEMSKIEDVNLPENSLDWHTRNAYMFSYYCAGIRISDLLILKWNNIHDGRIEYVMSKNSKSQSLRLNKKALVILSHYRGEMHTECQYIFPFLGNDCHKGKEILLKRISSKNAMINKALKDVALKAKVTRNLTFHMARHSFSDIVRQKGGDLYSISKALNHSRLSTTEAYLASFDQKSVDDLLDKIM